MENFNEYLEKNPKKLMLVLGVIAFCITANIVIVVNDFNLWLSIGVGLFTTLITFLIIIQVWGEYKEIEGLKDAIKEFFKWK